jgi:Domain of unknown function (DUF1834)
MAIEKDFEFYVGGIEDAVLDLLEEKLKEFGVKTFAYYSGELDSDNLKTALSTLTATFPLVMVSYTQGTDIEDPKTSAVSGNPIYFRHDCSFVVMCLSNDARGETARRRGKKTGNKTIGAYKMISKARKELGGVRFITNIDGEKITLNTPLIYADIEYIGKLPNITAYATHFETSFRFSTEDRTVETRLVDSLTLEVEKLNDNGNLPDNTPGVMQ